MNLSINENDLFRAKEKYPINDPVIKFVLLFFYNQTYINISVSSYYNRIPFHFAHISVYMSSASATCTTIVPSPLSELNGWGGLSGTVCVRFLDPPRLVSVLFITALIDEVLFK